MSLGRLFVGWNIWWLRFHTGGGHFGVPVITFAGCTVPGTDMQYGTGRKKTRSGDDYTPGQGFNPKIWISCPFDLKLPPQINLELYQSRFSSYGDPGLRHAPTYCTTILIWRFSSYAFVLWGLEPIKHYFWWHFFRENWKLRPGKKPGSPLSGSLESITCWASRIWIQLYLYGSGMDPTLFLPGFQA